MPADTEVWDERNAAFDRFKNEVARLVGEDLNAAGDHAASAATVYHYTNARNALSILRSGRFWFTERAHLNDTSEVQHGFRIAHEMFKEALEKAGPVAPQQAADHLMGEFGVGLSEYGYWVASFSYVNDDLSQWRSYADEGRGVCLGFSVQALDMGTFAAGLPDVTSFLRFPVRYDEALLRRKLQPYIELAIDLMVRMNLPAIPSHAKPYGQALLFERDVLRTMMSGLYLHTMMHKHRAYQHEQEYRLIVNGYRDAFEASKQHDVRVRNGEIIEYRSRCTGQATRAASNGVSLIAVPSSENFALGAPIQDEP
jgi:hypothetical protein